VAATVVRIFLLALMGAGIAVAGQYYGVWSAIVPTAGEITADKAVSPLPVAATEPSPQSAAAAVAPAMSPDLKKRLDALTQDLASVRDGLAALAAKQEQLATAQQLEQFAAAQQQIAAKQEQIAQTVAKLQASEATLRRKMTPPPTRAAVPAPPQAAPLPAPVEAQAAPASRATHPLPPLPVPAPPR
jgi:DNA-binding protein H-NS